ncbi:uncharacterized protein LOC132721983 isoform X2 [Ruditapes philippinarum]|uniref:uncharacterized protein LOC132721983 isoform X2 n=1 Tax=Ruditapes philippinarum TaxID=129788 RepID=UPI00295B733A|nr:uncharacterized protein LOC132721983 isoform X2 [Ruditapes philippinarum]
MSMLLEQKPENRNEGVASKKQAGRPAGYENMSQTLPTKTQILNQGDTVTRYTKDPTSKSNSQENEENTDEEENYGNVAMIKLAKKTDLTNKGQDDMKDMLEIQELGEAPKAPMPLPSSKGKKKGKEKSSAPKPEEHIPEDYVDMSGEQKQSAEKAGTSKAESRDSSELEDYENVNYKDIPVGRKAAVSKVTETSPEEGMEIYENAPGPTSKKTDGNNSDMEDYENTKELKLDKSKKPKGKGKAKPKADENEMEDYENMQDLELYENVHVSRKK